MKSASKPKRRKILFVSEFSGSNTGFGAVYYEIIRRLHQDDRFHVAEFAVGVEVNTPVDHLCTWRLYANEVAENDPRHQEFKSQSVNKYGAWRFNKVLLHFKPDIVVDFRDPQCFQFEEYSPLRPHYHWLIGPTVDSAPQLAEWVDVFTRADSVMPYTEFGCQVLQKEHRNIPLIEGVGQGIDLERFAPRNTKQAKQSLGIPPDAKVIGFVSRNQARKLFPELCQVFAEVRRQTGDDNLFLHLHTATPDLNTWNIPKILIEENIAHRVLFTYKCTKCNHTNIRKWQGSVTTCLECNHKSAVNPRTGWGCTKEEMATIFNAHDIYVQYATCEGFGFGALEAAASGTPILVVDHSAMGEIGRKVGGELIKCKQTRFLSTDAERAVPDFDDAVSKLRNLCELPKELLAIKGSEIRAKCEKNYNYDDVVNNFASILANIQLTGQQGIWDENTYVAPASNPYEGLIGELAQTFIEAGRPEMVNTNFFFDLYYRCLCSAAGIAADSVDINVAKNDANIRRMERVECETILSGQALPQEDFLEYAEIKEEAHK